MSDDLSVSVLITTYKRRETIQDVCDAWLAQPVTQVWMIDGGDPQVLPSYANANAPGLWRTATDPRFEYWPLWRDKGTRTDYALAHLTDGEWVICADDDLVPREGFICDLFAGIPAASPAESSPVIGVMGRTFHGPDYYRDTKHYQACDLEAPVRVGFCGVCFMAHRSAFGFDTKGMHRNTDDLWFQMRERPEMAKYVVPSKNYENLPSARDGMFHDKALRQVRRAFYRDYWERNYKPRAATW